MLKKDFRITALWDGIRKKQRIVFIWAFAAVLVAAYNLFGLNIRQISFIPKCYFLEITGLYCAGCGGTRAVHDLLTGNFLRSVRMNFIPFLTAAFFALYFLQHTLFVFFGWKIRIIILKTWMIWAFAGIVTGFWIFRNF